AGSVEHVGGEDRSEGDRDRARAEEEHRDALCETREADEDRQHDRIEQVHPHGGRCGDERDEARESYGADVEIDPAFHQRSSHVTLSQVTPSHVTPSHDTASHATPSQLTASQEMPSQVIPSHVMPGPNTFPLAARSRSSTRDGSRPAFTRAGRTVSASSTSRPGVRVPTIRRPLAVSAPLTCVALYVWCASRMSAAAPATIAVDAEVPVSRA